MNFVGNETAGMLGLLLCKDYVDEVVGYSKRFNKFANLLGFKHKNSIKSMNPSQTLCVHGREIFTKRELSYMCINVHPYLYAYKGADPVNRAIKNRNTKASVGAHYMTENIDEGPLIVEKFKDIKLGTPQEVYQQLYPLYVEVISEILQTMRSK